MEVYAWQDGGGILVALVGDLAVVGVLVVVEQACVVRLHLLPTLVVV